MAERREQMIPLFKVYMSADAPDKVGEVLKSGYIGQGPMVEKFESILKDWFDNDYIVTTNSATSAEHLALHLLKQPDEELNWPGMNEGDEVLATPLTCTATNWPILANGYKIKWVDVDKRTLNVDLDDLARKFTPKTKACMFVHWGGYPVDLDRLRILKAEIEEIYGFRPIFIEDCGHAFGATYKGQKLGNHGNICTYSMQAIKHMTSVDGGLMFSLNRRMHRRAKLVRWYGIDRETNKKDFRCEADIQEWGFKFHMNDVNAVVGIENLKEVDAVLEQHRHNALYYNSNLREISGIELLENNPDRESTYWIYSMLVDDKPGFIAKMKECNIMVSQVHERNDIHSCVSDFRCKLPNLDEVVPKTIAIPVGWWVTPEDREYIVDCIKEGW